MGTQGRRQLAQLPIGAKGSTFCTGRKLNGDMVGREGSANWLPMPLLQSTCRGRQPDLYALISHITTVACETIAHGPEDGQTQAHFPDLMPDLKRFNSELGTNRTVICRLQIAVISFRVSGMLYFCTALLSMLLCLLCIGN